MLSLTNAIKSRKISEFIQQEQERGVGPISEAEFYEAASTVIKTPQSDNQTSHSPRRDGSREK